MIIMKNDADLAPDCAGHLNHEDLVFFEIAIQLCQDVSSLHMGMRQILAVDCHLLNAIMHIIHGHNKHTHTTCSSRILAPNLHTPCWSYSLSHTLYTTKHARTPCRYYLAIHSACTRPSLQTYWVAQEASCGSDSSCRQILHCLCADDDHAAQHTSKHM